MEGTGDVRSFDLLATPVLVHGVEGVVHANPAFASLVGEATAEAVVGQQLAELVIAQDVDAARMLAVSTDPPAEAGHVRLRHRDGTSVPVDVDQTLRQTGSSPVAFASITDATARVESEDRLRRTHARIRALMENSSDIVAVHRDGCFRYLSPSVTRILGWEPAEMVGRHLREFTHPDDVERLEQRVRDRRRGLPSPDPGQYRLAHKDGGWRWIATVSTAHFDDPAIGGVVVNGRDVTTEVEASQALARSEARHRALVENLSDLIVVTDADGRVRYASPALARVLGPGLEPEARRSLFDGIHPDDRHRALERFGTVVRSGAGYHGPDRFRVLHADGSWRYLEVSASNRLDDAAVRGVIFVLRDVTAQQEIEEQFRHLALHDPLTGMANRTLLRDDLERALLRGRRDGTATAVLVVDLDRFKPVNDRFGHEAGDAVLCTLATRMVAAIRETDTLARFGGDEFAAVLPDAGSASDAVDVARRLVDAARAPVALAGYDLVVGASVGIALAPGHGDDADTLLTRADTAMFAAKADGTEVCVHGATAVRS